MKTHHYQIKMEWTGNEGEGTRNYQSYNRNHLISTPHKTESIPGSSDPSFRGDSSRYNPEELLVASLSSCHMLWYLHLCSVHKITVTAYVDQAIGTMTENKNGSGQFAEVILKPQISIKENSKLEKAKALHHQANEMCFIAKSCNFPVRHEPIILVEG